MSVIAHKKKCYCGMYVVWRSGKLDDEKIKHTWVDCYPINEGLNI